MDELFKVEVGTLIWMPPERTLLGKGAGLLIDDVVGETVFKATVFGILTGICTLLGTTVRIRGV